MSYAIPGSDLSPEQKKSFRQQAIEPCLLKAVHFGMVDNRAELIVRDLSPDELGLKSWATPKLCENQWVPWFNSVRPDIIISIYKCLQLSLTPKTSSISFYSGAKRAQFELESCYGGLPILQNLQKVLMDPVAREVLDELSGNDEKITPLCSTMEAWFTEPIVIVQNEILNIELYSHCDAPGDYLVLGGFVIERAGAFKR